MENRARVFSENGQELFFNDEGILLTKNNTDITIDYLKSKGFNCESIREQYKGDFKITLNRYGEYHYQFKESRGITDCELKTQKELELLYYAETGINL